MQLSLPTVVAPAVCTLICVFFGVGALLELRRYTPIYEAVWCKPGNAALGNVRATPSLSATVTVSLVCTNPNPYEIAVFPEETGTVYLGEERRDVGRMTSQRAVVPVPSGGDVGEAVITVHAEVALGFWETLAIADQIGRGAFTIYFNINLLVLIKPSMMLTSVAAIEIPVAEHCGMQIQLVPSQAIGDVVCSSYGFDVLQVPALQLSSDDSPGFTPAVSNETISDAEDARDNFCGALMFVGFGCGIVCALMFVGGLFTRRRPVTPEKSPRTCEANGVCAVPIGASVCIVASREVRPVDHE